jgi:surface protein
MTSLATFFYECLSLVKVRRIGEWDLTNITSLNRMFEGTPNFNDNVGGWNTSNVVDMQNAFAGTQKFNNGGSPDINNWDTSKVTSMRWMFGADGSRGILWHEFNQPIGDWNTSACTDMFTMFYRNSKFNQDINTKVVTKNGVTYTAWNTSNVTTMAYMFGTLSAAGYGAFNGNISNWNTSNVNNMYAMFQSQHNFNQDVSTKAVTLNGSTYTAWDTKNVTDMAFMFYAYPGFDGAFNQNIGNWNTSKVTRLRTMLQQHTSFNQDVGTKTVTVNGVTYTAWDTSLAWDMGYIFSSCFKFNNGGSDSINNWNVANATTMQSIFEKATAFNQPLNNWNTVKVTNMTGTFHNATSFNQSISNWKANLVTVFDNATTGFMQGKTFNDYSAANYDALLIGWASRPVLANKTINFGTIKYTSAAAAARLVLTSAPNNWTIIDGGQI